MDVMQLAQKALNGTARGLRDRFPVGFWISVAQAMGGGTFESDPRPGPLAGAPLRLPVDEFIFPCVMADGSWQPANHRRLARSLTDDSVLVDVGANLGLFTRQMMQEFPRLRRAVCFEPDAANFALMRYNLDHLRDKVHLVHAALSANTGSATLHRDPVNVGNYSLLRSATGGAGTCEIRTLAVAEAEAVVRAEAGAASIVYKSDTQGYDEYITCLFSDPFWDGVAAAALEIWQLPDKPAWDVDRFAAIVSRFPRREFTHRPGRNLSVEEIVAFARGTAGASDDLFLERA